jgi:hypothetical protein
VGNNLSNTWTITAADAGTLENTDYPSPTVFTFSNFPNITGGSANDTFTFDGNFQLTGGINGGSGSNTIVGPDLATNWQITSTDAGTLDPGVGTTSFTNIQNLTGGNTTDDFAFADGQGLSGAIDGGAPAASNTLDYTAFTTSAEITFTTSTSGTASNLGSGFTNIGNIVGNFTVITSSTRVSAVNLAKFNSLNTQLFLALNEVNRFRLMKDFAWMQFEDPMLWLLTQDELKKKFITYQK